MNEKIINTLLKLESIGLISSSGDFEIDDVLVSKYQEIYGKGKETKGNSEINTKLAILNLLKYKKGSKRASDIPEGWVYVVSNPLWKGVKIGKAIDVRDRVKTMQTYAPAEYALEHYVYSTKALQVEKHVHRELSDARIRGEWFNISPLEAFKIIKRVCDVIV
jgi:hypothetical protein